MEILNELPAIPQYLLLFELLLICIYFAYLYGHCLSRVFELVTIANENPNADLNSIRKEVSYLLEGFDRWASPMETPLMNLYTKLASPKYPLNSIY